MPAPSDPTNADPKKPLPKKGFKKLSRVKRFGFEIEGGWNTLPRGVNAVVPDGSVYVSARHVGELRTPILAEWAHAAEFIERCYPDVVGPSCGIHVHMSFGARSIGGPDNDAIIAMLADSDEYRLSLTKSLQLWGEIAGIKNEQFWLRLAGRNEFCRARIAPSALNGGGERYCAVNFDSYNRHGTVEVRVLPSFVQRAIAARAIMQVLVATEAYLEGAMTRIEKVALVENEEF